MALRCMYRGPASTNDELVERLQQIPYETGIIAVDTETISIKDLTCIGIGLQVSPTESFYIEVWPDPSDLLSIVTGLIADTKITKLYFNANFDFRVLEFLHETDGCPLPDYINIADASIAAQIQGQTSHSLDDLSLDLLNTTNEYSISGLLDIARLEEGRRSVSMLDVPFEAVATKCLNDVWATWHLWEKLQHTWPNQQNKECYDIDIALIPVLKSMERKGLLLDKEVVESEYVRLRREVMGYSDICSDMGFNPGSGQQVGYILASRGNILPFTKSRKQLRTDEESLSDIDDPIAKLVLQYRKAVKLLGTYIEPWRGQDRAHTCFRIDLSTGRLASFDRNLQNIPPSMRQVFSPDRDYFSWLDFSQIEMRILAWMSGDPTMLDAYKLGIDIHALTQLELWPGSDVKDEAKRLVAKTFNFAMAYNANTYTLAKHTKLPERICYEFRQRWLNLYRKVWEYMETRARDTSTYATTDFGRRMSLPSLDTSPQTHIDKCKINYAIQGTAADIIKRAMLKVGGDLRLQVHDELVFDGDMTLGEELTHIHPDIYTPYNTYKEKKWH